MEWGELHLSILELVAPGLSRRGPSLPKPAAPLSLFSLPPPPPTPQAGLVAGEWAAGVSSTCLQHLSV